jgi:hypothetical protein
MAPRRKTKTRDEREGFERIPQSVGSVKKTLPLADIIEARYPYTTTHQVWINNWLVCGTDRDYIADMIVRAINEWAKTPDCKAWLREQT